MYRVLVPFREPDRLAPYLDAVSLAGLEPVPFLVNGPASLSNVAGLVLTGGTDVDPARYGQRAHSETEPPDPDRDEIELELLHQSIETDIPVLAICRGFQLLNVHQGGTLLQHIPSGRHRVLTPDKADPAHDIDVDPGSRLHTILQASRAPVNSRHHQALDGLGSNLTVVARSVDDNVVEAVEFPGKRFILGVQWHPENQVRRFPEQLRLFQALSQALSG